MLKKLYSCLVAASLMLAMGTVAAQGGMGGGMGAPDLTEAAETLGITQEALLEALGSDGPPDFAATAEKLGITEEELTAAMPARAEGGGGMGAPE